MTTSDEFEPTTYELNIGRRGLATTASYVTLIRVSYLVLFGIFNLNASEFF
jgi:hypothetical protein